MSQNHFYLIHFTGRTNLWFLRILKPGFRHCEIYLCKPNQALIHANPLSNGFILNAESSLAISRKIKEIQENGDRFLLYVPATPPAKKLAPLLPVTCVEICKRILGIHSWKILTPYQLHNYLVKQNKKIT